MVSSHICPNINVKFWHSGICKVEQGRVRYLGKVDYM